MYVIKFRQIYPEGDWCDWRDADGRVMGYEAGDDARRQVDKLRADWHNQGYEFRVDTTPSVDPESQAACDSRDFLV